MIDLYESFKEESLVFLDEVFEFKKKHIYGCAYSNENREPAIVQKSDIKGQIAHLRDEAKATGICVWGKNPLANELRNLKAARAKIEAKLTYLQE